MTGWVLWLLENPALDAHTRASDLRVISTRTVWVSWFTKHSRRRLPLRTSTLTAALIPGCGIRIEMRCCKFGCNSVVTQVTRDTMFHELGVLAVYNFFIFLAVAFGVGFWKRDRKSETLFGSRAPRVASYYVANGASSLFHWMSVLVASGATRVMPRKVEPPKPKAATGINPDPTKPRRRAPIAAPGHDDEEDIMMEVIQGQEGVPTEPTHQASSPPALPACGSTGTRSGPSSPRTPTPAPSS